MSHAYYVHANTAHKGPTRMSLLEMLEKRRFSLSLIGAFAFVGAFSNMVEVNQYTLSVQMFSTKLLNVLQSLV